MEPRVTSDQWAWSSADSGWLGEGGLFRRAKALFIVVSAGPGAISGKGMRDTMGLGKGVVVLVIIVGVLGYFRLGSGELVGLTASRLLLGLFIETLSETIRFVKNSLLLKINDRISSGQNTHEKDISQDKLEMRACGC